MTGELCPPQLKSAPSWENQVSPSPVSMKINKFLIIKFCKWFLLFFSYVYLLIKDVLSRFWTTDFFFVTDIKFLAPPPPPIKQIKQNPIETPGIYNIAHSLKLITSTGKKKQFPAVSSLLETKDFKYSQLTHIFLVYLHK